MSNCLDISEAMADHLDSMDGATGFIFPTEKIEKPVEKDMIFKSPSRSFQVSPFSFKVAEVKQTGVEYGNTFIDSQKIMEKQFAGVDDWRKALEMYYGLEIGDLVFVVSFFNIREVTEDE